LREGATFPHKIVHLNPFISSSLGIGGREVYPSLREEGAREMKKDEVTLRSHDLKGYEALKWRVQYFYFSIRLIYSYLVQQKTFRDLTGIRHYATLCYIQ
jgi:hypothetical protein